MGTVLRVIHDVAERIGIDVLQMALGGRAAQQLRGTTGREASTIAAFLHAAARGLVDPASEPLIIIDESSMLDLPLTLIRGIEQVVFIGDRDAFERAIVAAPHSQGRQAGFSM